MKRIAVLTSGGDAPGMNAAIRTVVRMGISQGWEVFGIRNGYAGLFDDRLDPLGARDVGSILQRGGTFLGSARFPRWKEPEIRVEGLANLRRHRIDALVVIGGNGSQTGAYALSKMDFPVIGVASTIDNDLVLHRDHDRRRHGPQHRARIDRSPPHHRLVAQARLRGRGDGPQLRLPGADGGSGGRCRGHPGAGGRGQPRRRRRPTCRAPGRAASSTRWWWSPRGPS